MQYVTLGNTGLKVSKLCLGCMTYGSKAWRQWILEEEESQPYLKKSLDAGINFFDTANVYSDGVSEEILGRFVKANASGGTSWSSRPRSTARWGRGRTRRG